MEEIDVFEELQAICGDVKQMTENGVAYVYLPKVKLPAGCQPQEVEGLLCPQSRDGYVTRLFLSAQFPGRGPNWSTHRILDRTWYACSWKDVSPNLRLAQMVAEHLRALR